MHREILVLVMAVVVTQGMTRGFKAWIDSRERLEYIVDIAQSSAEKV